MKKMAANLKPKERNLNLHAACLVNGCQGKEYFVNDIKHVKSANYHLFLSLEQVVVSFCIVFFLCYMIVSADIIA